MSSGSDDAGKYYGVHNLDELRRDVCRSRRLELVSLRQQRERIDARIQELQEMLSKYEESP